MLHGKRRWLSNLGRYDNYLKLRFGIAEDDRVTKKIN